MPCGSNSHVLPRLARKAAVSSDTSRLFVVARTLPGASRMAGMTRLLVLPCRAPHRSTDTSSGPLLAGRLPGSDRPSGEPAQPGAPGDSRADCFLRAAGPSRSRSRRPDR